MEHRLERGPDAVSGGRPGQRAEVRVARDRGGLDQAEGAVSRREPAPVGRCAVDPGRGGTGSMSGRPAPEEAT